MANKREIFLPHGNIKKLSELTGILPGLCSNYCKGWWNENNKEVNERAELVRKTALEKCGGFYKTTE